MPSPAFARALAAIPTTPAPATVLACYDLLSLSLLAGVEDYTDGRYRGDRSTPYAMAQQQQHDYLLEQLGVGPGFRLLDVGCGSGSLVRRARQRGADVTGITISPAQVEIGRGRGLDVRLINYLDLAAHFGAEFDGIVANGSIEHFCQPETARAGKQDAVYSHMFALFHALLRADSPAARVVTTVIHFRRAALPPRAMLASPWRSLFDPPARHGAILHRGYGGYYPVTGQLARAAAPCFALVAEEDGTEDYALTSAAWREHLGHALRHAPLFRRQLLRIFVQRPRHTTWMLLSFFGARSWLWQFEGPVPPMRLLRQTWQGR